MEFFDFIFAGVAAFAIRVAPQIIRKTAEIIKNEVGVAAKWIDIDLNPDPKYKSNFILRSALGYVESMGYTPRCKPNAMVASYVADALCK